MRNGLTRKVALLAVATLALSACGGGGGGEKKEAASCQGHAIANTGLPSDFPVPEVVTFTEAHKDGPSQIVDGYTMEDLDGIYKEWKDILGQGNYSVLFDEKEEHDAEISYLGPTTTGQVAVRDDCGGGRIAVHVSSRPK
jgi:hypothetical protein